MKRNIFVRISKCQALNLLAIILFSLKWAGHCHCIFHVFMTIIHIIIVSGRPNCEALHQCIHVGICQGQSHRLVSYIGHFLSLGHSENMTNLLGYKAEALYFSLPQVRNFV